ncbi:hypothetical protein CDL12_09915 [Handroanthus impetiginosus]|uniref:Transcriptional coactivator Hfi1/Transcriptional adapter 1 n=1 Tax=Handroanthus impetiginosus TaxID=429701 RepID=A0A2G9HIR9_9LAMI|nr:hypothetical protein CDL12_09915 [Handroanthus impetiginosus]
MVTMNLGVKMPGDRHCPRIDTTELKNHIERRVGHQKAEKYFNLLNRYLSRRLRKSEFDKLCIQLLGRENISLHNGLIRAVIKNACIAKSPPPKDGKVQSSLNVKVPNGYQSSLQSLCRDVFPQSPRKGRTPTLRDRKFKDRPSPLGPHAKPRNVACDDPIPMVQEQQSATEILSLGSRPPVEVTSVEEGEEVEQVAGSPGIHSRSPLRAPLGVCLHAKGRRKVLSHGSSPFINLDTCCKNAELPDTSSLRKRVEQKLEMESLNVSMDCVNLLNNGLDAFLKRLLKPCLDLAASRSECKLPNKVHHQSSIMNGTRAFTCAQKYSVSMTDFQVAMQSNPRILGEDWPVQLEKVSLCASEGYMDG